MTTRLPLHLVLLCAVRLATAGEWTNIGGKSISADFVRVDTHSVLLRSGNQTYSVPLGNLSPESRRFALYCQKEVNKWAAEVAASPILPEQAFVELLALAPSAVEGRRYLIEGNVGTLKAGTSLSPTPETPTIILDHGTPCTLNFRTHISNSTKVRLDGDRITLMKATNLTITDTRATWTNFSPVQTLVEVGQPIVIRAIVTSGRVVGQGEADFEEVTAARAAVAFSQDQLRFGEAQHLQIRMRYLESILAENAAPVTNQSATPAAGANVTAPLSDAEIAAMREELELVRAEIAAMAR